MSNDRIRVVVADDHAVVRTGLRALLRSTADIEVVGEAGDGAGAVALAEELRPDVVVLDLSMPVMDGVQATRAIVARGLPCRVLIVTVHTGEDEILALVDAGATGYVTKDHADVELVNAVRTVAKGEIYLRPAAARIVARAVDRQRAMAEERSRFERLTGREQDVLRLVAFGHSAPEIGDRLSISPKTVDTYKHRIAEKAGLQHRSDYVQFALRLGLFGAA